MRKKLLIGLSACVVLLWTTVLVILLLPRDSGRLPASEHSYSRLDYGVEEKLMKQVDRDNPSAILSSEGQPEDILGSMEYTQSWVDDVTEDGKLSIDTILEHLDSME
ncbi:hypothetical protein JF544_16930 [Halobacillus kuroshimensis]|uniref:Uncharacterized protein n=1 Tax=Halobacillus kuroshimensis TaxID=302481 RepID=A0ABS3E031_9BACI|nr:MULTISPECIES: hypothetical protein [Halobacillus]MBN8236946.1 hypothetical protein [Halobacillus kuroshimensis]